ncbi:MAG TPA: bacterial transcriptional activator domain-containing protein [Acidimicrobiales bacterium]|jgi:DNA-binding SARP family transcriptional activator|nr:bacterial transcriptional activator domain-containing protein [Acidimicrobiales bacterium]
MRAIRNAEPRRRALRDAVVGVAAALLVFGAVPGVLVAFVGVPLPHHWSEHVVVSLHGLFDLLAVVSWGAWATCAWPILRSVASRVRSGDVVTTARLSDRIAVRIAIGVLALSSFLGIGVSTAGATTAGVAGASAHVTAPAPLTTTLRIPTYGNVLTSEEAVTRSGTGSSSPGESHLVLAELAAAGISALVAGLLARRARQLRRLRAFLREEGEASSAPTEQEADLGVLVAPFEELPLVELIEVAARHLADATATLRPVPGAVQWLRAGTDGVEVHFDEPVPAELPGWRRCGAAKWLFPAGADVAALRPALEHREPWCTALLPLGDDERGTWLLPAIAGSSVAVVGPRAADLALAMRAAVSSWSWHEGLVVTEDATRAIEATAHADAQVLFVGDPSALPAETRRACAVLAPRQVDDAEVTVFVDSRAASAHPLGLCVRPPLLGSWWKPALDALVEPAAGGRSSTSQLASTDSADSADSANRGPSRPLVHRHSAPATVRIPESGLSADGRARGRAEVRLLATLPGIAGLQGELPPKRARRAVELIAYLAMHAPDPVTGDRLRTRVLGSADADAAAKTLFNTVGAARRALGSGPDGEPLLPPASRTGHYRLSPLVTVDALRACALLRDGLGSRDAAESVTRLRDGLELVKGEPLGGVLTGYAWWRAEGHERRVADAVVDGACALVRAALASGEIDLARWALDQARKVEPYSEALTRAAMRVAAATGDARRLHAEWRECLRQVDELDPGGAPSEGTEQLYALLRAQVSGDGLADAAVARV